MTAQESVVPDFVESRRAHAANGWASWERPASRRRAHWLREEDTADDELGRWWLKPELVD